MADTLYDKEGRPVEVGSPTERVRLLGRGYTTRNPKPAAAPPVEPKPPPRPVERPKPEGGGA